MQKSGPKSKKYGYIYIVGRFYDCIQQVSDINLLLYAG
jgi:hypothetical protein